MVNIVVMEQDPALAWLLREELEDAGFSVRMCRDIEQASMSLNREPAHLLVSDVCGLPDFTGLNVGALARRHSCEAVLLGPRYRAPGHSGEPMMLQKTSDLRPLITYLRSQATKALWLNSAQ